MRASRGRPGLAADARARIEGLGDVLVCHSTPASDDADLHALTPDDELRRRCSGRSRPMSCSAGTRTCSTTARSRAASGWSTPGASACPTRAPAARTGRCWDRRRVPPSEYDVEACVAAIQVLGAPLDEEQLAVAPGSARLGRRHGALRSLSVPRSYVREARRRGLGRRRERIVPIIERLAAEHADAEIALRFR